MDHAAVGFAVAAGDQRCAVGQFVFADFAVEDELIEGRLHHGHGRRQLFQVDEPEAGVVGGRQEGRRRPAGAVGAVAPRDAAQVHGVEEERTDVDILAAGVGGDLLGDGALGAARSSPQDHRLAGLDQQREGGGEFARAQRVVGGDGVGIGHGQDSGMAGMGRRGTPGPRPSPRPERRSAHRVAGCGDGAPCGWPAPGRRVAAARTSGPVGRRTVRLGPSESGRSRRDAGQLRQGPARRRQGVADALLNLRVAGRKGPGGVLPPGADPGATRKCRSCTNTWTSGCRSSAATGRRHG